MARDYGIKHFNLVVYPRAEKVTFPLFFVDTIVRLGVEYTLMNSVIQKKRIVGVDEVGRGPLAGPVAVCAVVLPKKFNIEQLKGIDDSKKLSPQKREEWYMRALEWRRDGEIEFYIRTASAQEIDTKGIARVIRSLVASTLSRVEEEGTLVLLDGLLYAPERFSHQETIVGGDAKEVSIAFASVIAKVFRDRKMKRYALEYPSYGFETHMGYGTLNHRRAIEREGVTTLHRKSYLKNISYKI